jgi:twitching motility protein PilJ
MKTQSRGIALLPVLGILLILILALAAGLLWYAERNASVRGDWQASVTEIQLASQRLPRLAMDVLGGSRNASARLESEAAELQRKTVPLGGQAADAGRQLNEAARRLAAAAAPLAAAQAAAENLRSASDALQAETARVTDGLPPAEGETAVTGMRRALRDARAAADALVHGIGDPEGALRDLEAAGAAAEEVMATLPEDAALGTARQGFQAQLRALLAGADEISTARAAAAEVRSLGDRLQGAIPEAPAGGPAWLGFGLPLGLAILALILATVLVASLWRGEDARRRAVEHARQNERNQQAILRLLDELGSLADGDLTVQASVTEDITGAIADSINYAIEALRDLVTTINQSAIKLDAAAKQTQATATHMNDASETQHKQASAATESIARMAASIEAVSGDAERAADVARHSVDVAHKGGAAVRRTIEGMNAIRETIQDTSKRIKRLGESSQEIGNIIELINDIAEQTNILALNASIQASMAGDAGRGFAVVADEVQRLSERAANATRQIEVLVKTIQSDTNEAVTSMERSTTDVVGGALLAENAGAALDEIESVSNQIANLVQNISRTARDQATAAGDITRNMNVLREVSAQTAEATGATSTSIRKLADLAAQLRSSAAGFRLPEPPPPPKGGRGAAKR